MKVGYVRVSTVGQNTARQEALMQELGVERVFIDRQSGKDTSRPELQRLLEFVREGDTVAGGGKESAPAQADSGNHMRHWDPGVRASPFHRGERQPR